MSPRRRRRHEAVVIMLGGILLSAIAGLAWAAYILAHALVLIAVAAGFVVAYRLGQRRRPPVRLVQARPVGDDAELAGLRAENTRLQAQVSQLRREVQDATTAMHAAWDAVSSVPPRPRSEHGMAREQLLADPCAGARPIGGPR